MTIGSAYYVADLNSSMNKFMLDDEGNKKQGYLFEQKKQGTDLGKFKLLMTN